MRPARTVKVADVAVAGTVTVAATGSRVLLLERDTIVPPAGAAAAKVTVQVLIRPGSRLVGEHCSEEMLGTVP